MNLISLSYSLLDFSHSLVFLLNRTLVQVTEPNIQYRGKKELFKNHCLSLVSQSFVQSLAVVCSYVTYPFLSIFENLFPHSGQRLQTLPLKESYPANLLCLLTLRNLHPGEHFLVIIQKCNIIQFKAEFKLFLFVTGLHNLWQAGHRAVRIWRENEKMKRK